MKLYTKFILGVLTIASLGACTEKFDEMNTDPNSLVTVSPAYILPFIQETVVNTDSGPYQRGDNLHSQFYCQFFTNTIGDWTSGRYGYNEGWAVPGFWEPYYTSLKHMKVIKEMAEKDAKYTDIYQMARITVAFGTIGMTDLFGDIPYSEAGTGNSAPKYDSQKDIYYDVFNELKEAADILGQHLEGQENCGANNDLIFGGDNDKWVKFANSLRLRYALRIAYKDPAKAKAEGEAAIAGGVMASNDDNAYVRIDGSGRWGHPLYMISQWDGFTMSKTMENILKNSSTVHDPRMPLWFGASVGWWNHQNGTVSLYKGEQFSGVPNGLTTTELLAADDDGWVQYDPKNNSFVYGVQAYPDWNKSGKLGNSKVALNFKVMNYAETCQLKAEAALRGWTGAGDIKTNYEAGIRASFAEERAPIADATLYSETDDETYITTGWVKWDSAASDEEKLERIITQKWLSTYPNGIEAWAECRRTGYPKLMPVSKSEDPDINPANGEFIKKIRYSDVERRENKANATDPSLNEGQGDGQAVRVWWDTKRYK